MEKKQMPTFRNPEDAPDKLTKLLLHAAPKNKRGHKTLSHLAELIGVSNWGMRKWIIAQKIPPDRAMSIVDVSEGRVAIQDFHDFVYKS